MKPDDYPDAGLLVRLAAWVEFHPDADVRAARERLLQAREQARQAAAAAAIAEAEAAVAEARWRLRIAARGLH